MSAMLQFYEPQTETLIITDHIFVEESDQSVEIQIKSDLC